MYADGIACQETVTILWYRGAPPLGGKGGLWLMSSRSSLKRKSPIAVR